VVNYGNKRKDLKLIIENVLDKLESDKSDKNIR
jgi:hypothetical protein